MATSGDCVILRQNPPQNSMFINVSVGSGFAQVRRNVGNFTWNYRSDMATTSVQIRLNPQEEYTGTATNALFIYTDNPVTLALIRDGELGPTEIAVRRMMFIDQEATSFRISNNGSDAAMLWINYASSSSVTTDPVDN